MVGGAGNDVYYVDKGWTYTATSRDVVTENASEGIDLVYSSDFYVLGANVENLVLTGSNTITGGGNTLDNSIVGNSANNILESLAGNDTLDGGAGADTLIGGLDNDTYIVDNIAEVLTESTGQGTDRVRSSIAWTLAANFENLTLTGTDAINGTGNSAANDMVGNIAANLLTSYDGNDTVNGGGGVDTLIGGTGNDLYRVDNSADIVTELSGEGADTIEATASYSLAGVSNIEALILMGSGNINATGNANADVLTGNAGNNILDGGAGADTLTGGLGDDIYIIDDAGDVFTEAAGAGIDTVVINASHTLSANFENLTLTGSAALTGAGNSSDNVITGNSGDNTLTGADGNDTLDGGIGADSLTGGNGDDTYVIDNAGDVVAEAAGAGTDIVRSYLSHTLAADFEHLTLLGTAASATGNASANAITGNAAANTLDGGAGADTLSGGAGNDAYIVDDAGDLVVENPGEGIDTIYASVSFNAVANVENVVLTGSGNTASTGNSLANTITGNSGDNGLSGSGGNDTLSGGDGDDSLNGGSGVDSMTGGTGNDVYYVDNSGDVVVEAAGEGTDTVSSSISYAAAANIEAVTLSGSGHTAATGNSGSNTLTGNSGNNTLSGGDGSDTLSSGNGHDSLDGGLGADSLTGGAGDDVYVVDDAGDVVIETSGQGADTVFASVNYALAADVESLVLTGSAATGIGNGLANAIIGTATASLLTGGAGDDSLTGGADSDDFVFADVATNGTDTITDFEHGIDRLVFAGADYGFAASHSLSASEFTIGTSAVGTDAQFIWDDTTGHLYWDADGTGSGAAVDLALVVGAVTGDDLYFT